MQIFGRLNAAGRTIIIITHEDDVSAHAKRVIMLEDGRIAGDRRNAPVAGDPPGLIDLTAMESTEVSVEEAASEVVVP
jgi:putative ABC transport system ATP-binding protein